MGPTATTACMPRTMRCSSGRRRSPRGRPGGRSSTRNRPWSTRTRPATPRTSPSFWSIASTFPSRSMSRSTTGATRFPRFRSSTSRVTMRRTIPPSSAWSSTVRGSPYRTRARVPRDHRRLRGGGRSLYFDHEGRDAVELSDRWRRLRGARSRNVEPFRREGPDRAPRFRGFDSGLRGPDHPVVRFADHLGVGDGRALVGHRTRSRGRLFAFPHYYPGRRVTRGDRGGCDRCERPPLRGQPPPSTIPPRRIDSHYFLTGRPLSRALACF